jgi:hypothetical protein
MVTIKRRILHILIAIDRLLWAILSLGGGDPDETISCAMYRYEKEGWLVGKLLRPVIDIIFFWDDQHCRKAYLAEQIRIIRLHDYGR